MRFGSLKEEFPEYRTRLEMIENILEHRDIARIDEEILQNLRKETEHEIRMRTKIERNLKANKIIYIQYGENLDIKASKYALKRHMKEKFGINIKEVRVNAGDRNERFENGLFVDAGNLEGNVFSNNKIKEVNANTKKAQKSACGVLHRFGIYVPPQIVRYADIVTDERIINARYGLYLIRKLKDEKLFEFAERRREDGTFLIDSDLTDEEIEEYGLTEDYQKRAKDINEDVEEIRKNIYSFEEEKEGIKTKRYICMVDRIVICGAQISYALGCDYYFSVAPPKKEAMAGSKSVINVNQDVPRATFSMLANPKTGNGQLPDKAIEYFINLRDRGENDLFKIITVRGQEDKEIQNQKPYVDEKGRDKVIFGGPKTPNLFVTVKDYDEEENITESIMYEVGDIIGAKKVKTEEVKQLIENSMTKWKNKSAKSFMESILQNDELEKAALDIHKNKAMKLEQSKDESEKLSLELQKLEKEIQKMSGEE